MMADFEVKLDGLGPVLAKMQKLKREIRLKPARSALGQAAKLIRQQAQQNALQVNDPDTGRTIADNIVQRFRSRYHKRTGDLMISVGVGTEKGHIPKGNPDTGPKGNTPHWHLLELGTERMPAQPFLAPAARQQAEAAMHKFGSSLDKGIDRILKKAGK